MDVRAFLEELKRQPGYDGQVVYERFIPPRTARYAELSPPLPSALLESLQAQGIARRYTHQVEAAAAGRQHRPYVVIDDVHIYRGVFGSNVANILRRLRRVCRLHGADPVFVCTSATIANPAEFVSALLSLPVTVVDADGSPGGPRWFVFWNPPIIDPARAHRRSSYSEATALFVELIRAGVRTIALTQAPKIT